MDLPSFLLGLLPTIAIGFVCVVTFRRRHDRGGTSPLILNPYTLAVEPDADARGHLPLVQPAPATTSSQTMDTSSIGLGTDNVGPCLVKSPTPARPSKKV